METNKIKQAAEIAKTKTSDKRWINAIDKAVAGVENGWIVTYETHGIMVTTENGTYRANGSCQCKAFAVGQACKHRALARLVEIADGLKDEPTRAERQAQAVQAKAELIAEIKTTFAAKFPGYSLTATVNKLVGPYTVEMLAIPLLRRVLAAIV